MSQIRKRTIETRKLPYTENTCLQPLLFQKQNNMEEEIGVLDETQMRKGYNFGAQRRTPEPDEEECVFPNVGFLVSSCSETIPVITIFMPKIYIYLLIFNFVFFLSFSIYLSYLMQLCFAKSNFFLNNLRSQNLFINQLSKYYFFLSQMKW